MNNLKPFGDRVLVQRIEEKNTTQGGIILPDSMKKNVSNYARVLDIGSKVTIVNHGDVVFFSKYSNSVDVDDTLVLVKEEDILAYVTKEDIEDLAGSE